MTQSSSASARRSPYNLGKRARMVLLVCFELCLAGPAGVCPAAVSQTNRPNIIFILVDDLRWDALSCMGHPFAKTPHIDRIAREGALFKNFFVSIPLCSPSRASFLTGQYAHRHGVIDNSDHSALSHTLVTFPRLLHDRGYETACVGKWHMGNDDSPRPGFDHWVSFKGQGVYLNPVINVDGVASKIEGYITDILNEQALRFLERPHEKPFLLYLAHKAVHGPFTPAERHQDLYSNNTLTPSPGHHDTLEGKPALTRPVDLPANPKNPKKKKSAAKTTETAGRSMRLPQAAVRGQLRALAAVDEGVGEIFNALERTKQLDNTLVIFSSDNGFFWGEHGLADKRWPYEESIRDPFLMRLPRLIKPGSTFDQLVLNIDLAPTLLELAGAPIPKSIQGRSLLPLLGDPKTVWRSSFFCEYFQEKPYPQTPTWQAVRSQDWKYIHYPDLKDMDELYEIRADPAELKNRIKDEGAQTRLADLKTELEKILKSSN